MCFGSQLYVLPNTSIRKQYIVSSFIAWHVTDLQASQELRECVQKCVEAWLQVLYTDLKTEDRWREAFCDGFPTAIQEIKIKMADGKKKELLLKSILGSFRDLFLYVYMFVGLYFQQVCSNSFKIISIKSKLL